MTHLTRSQRFTIYCIMLAEAEDPQRHQYGDETRWPKENGLCWMYRVIFGTTDMYHNISQMFPELSQFIKSDWWGKSYEKDAWEIRIEALKKCIELTS